MKSHARVVVIGGGAVGVATLYQLARKGWSDVVLVERKELTSGSTWHAAGLLPLFNMSYSVGQIHKALGRALPDAGGRDRPERRLRQGLQHPPRAEPRPHGRVPPVCRRRGDDRRRGRVPDAAAGQGDLAALQHRGRDRRDPPSRATATSSRPTSPRRWPRARAIAAPRSTARPGSPASRRRRRASGGSRPTRATITCEHVVSATGNFARRTGAMVGLDVPVIPVEHQYIVTEPHPEIVAPPRAGPARDGRAARERRLLVSARGGAAASCSGPTRRARPAAISTGRATDSEYELFQDDLERLTPHIEAAINRVPAFGEVGVKQVYNGAIPLYAGRQPDHRPGLGPAQFLAERGPQLRHHRGRRRGLAARRVDHRGRAHDRHAGRRPAPLRRLRLQGLSAREERGGLRQRLHDPLSGRGARRRPAAAHGALLRPHEGPGRGVRPEVRLGAAELVRAEGHAAGGPLVVPPLALVRARRQRVPQRHAERRPARHDRVRQGARLGPGRGGVPRPPGRQPHPAKNRPAQPLPRAQQPRRRALRVHDPARGAGQLLSGLGRRLAAARPRLAAQAHAGRRLGAASQNLTDAIGVLVVAGPRVARAVAAGQRRGLLQRRLPLAHRPGDRRRPRAGPRAPGQLRRRAGLGAAPPARVPEPHLRSR